MAFTEFCCRNGGSNLNAGSLDGSSTEPGTAPFFTAVGDSDGTSVFTPSDGSNPAASGVIAGQFASVYVTAGATVSTYVGIITSVGAGVGGTITVSTTAKAGVFPTASAGAHSITIRVGGAWQGPNGAVGFPFNFASSSLATAVRVNLKSDQTYAITAAMTQGPTASFVGYASSYGDGGRATFDGGAAGSSYTLLTLTGNPSQLADLVFAHNGATGANSAVAVNAIGAVVERCVVHDVVAIGWSIGAASTLADCEAYACNQGNASNGAGFSLGPSAGGTQLIRCVSHDQVNATGGFGVSSTAVSCTLDSCVIDSNAAAGFTCSPAANASVRLQRCDFYGNAGGGAAFSTGGAFVSLLAENCNFVANGGYGISQPSGSLLRGRVSNCGFGSGTQANVSGQTSSLGGAVAVVNPITYPADVTPWVGPAGGDFRVALAAAKAIPYAFTQTQAGYAGTVAYSDVGAGQASSAGGGGGGLVWFP
jgi:hypothetical protein